MAFNLKKYKESRKPYEKLLEDNNKERGFSSEENNKNFNKILDSDRKEKEDVVIEKFLEESRSNDKKIPLNLEGKLNEDTSSWMKNRRDDGEHPMDYHKKTEDKYVKDFKKEDEKEEKDKDNEFKSQLLSNYKTRKDFNRKNKVASIEESILDADAILYTIYRIASEQGRELEQRELKVVEEINNYKIEKLSQFYGGGKEYEFVEESDPNIKDKEDLLNRESDKEGYVPSNNDLEMGNSEYNFKEEFDPNIKDKEDNMRYMDTTDDYFKQLSDEEEQYFKDEVPGRSENEEYSSKNTPNDRRFISKEEEEKYEKYYGI